VATYKLLSQLRHLFGARKHDQIKQIESLKDLLKKLKKRQRTLRKKIGQEKESNKRRLLQEEIDWVQAQRKKGARLIKKLRLSSG
jgi:hypothetical protein